MKKESTTTKKAPVKPSELLKNKPKVKQQLKSKPKKKPIQTNSKLMANMTNSLTKETSE